MKPQYTSNAQWKKQPSHILSMKFANSDFTIALNPSLIALQGISQSAVNFIIELHEEKNKIFDRMLELTPEDDILELRELVIKLEDLEFKMQHHWGFSKDENFHTHWILAPHCKCPKLDNADRLGTGKVISGICPLHGD
jgi:hypothetical protein